MDNPLLSIIVPVYNVEQYIEEALDSILKQSFTDFELILINDGSTDKSGLICEEYAAKDKRILVVHQTNNGVSAARNTGLNNVSGKYITFIDPDDVVSQETFLRNIQYLEEHADVDIIQYPAYYYYGSDKAYFKLIAPCVLAGKEQLLRYWWSGDLLDGALWNKFFRSSLFKGITFREGHIFEDCYLICDFIDRVNKVYISDVGCYYYCHRNNSYTNTNFSLCKHLDLYTSYIRSYQMLYSFHALRKYRVPAFMRVYRRLMAAKQDFPDHDISANLIELKQCLPRWTDLLVANIPCKEKARFIKMRMNT